MSQHAFISSAFHSIATKFPLSRHIFLWLFNTFPARFVVLSILCRNTLVCGCWNIYVATLKIMFRHCFCTASSNCVTTQLFMSQHHFCWFFVATMFIVLSAFLSRTGKFVATESCPH